MCIIKMGSYSQQAGYNYIFEYLCICSLRQWKCSDEEDICRSLNGPHMTVQVY